jgi:hypothetical protein
MLLIIYHIELFHIPNIYTPAPRHRTMSNFSENWKPPFVVMKSIERAARYDILETDRKFRTGRPMVQVLFVDRAGTEITRRQGMVLNSKRTGDDYIVCRTTGAPTSYRPSQPEMVRMVENCHVGMSELYD